MNALTLTDDTVRQLQHVINEATGAGLVEDGQAGPKTDAAFTAFADAWDLGISTQLTPAPDVHSVMASSFADPADVAAFQRAKAEGMSDEEAFKYGDNAIGCWGNSTAEGTGPQCALPPEDWQHLAHPHGTKVEVAIGTRSAVGILGDTMPRRADITNGAGIDLNPDFCAALGVKPGNMWKATWRWA